MQDHEAPQELVELIRRRRAQLMVHSYIYYQDGDNLIPDSTWDKWAYELVELQKQVKEINFFDELFADWDGSTGFHLTQNHWVQCKAAYLLTHRKTQET